MKELSQERVRRDSLRKGNYPRNYSQRRGVMRSDSSKTTGSPLKGEVGTLRSFKDQSYKLEPVPTGVENLGKLFFISYVSEGKVTTKILGGFPREAVINISGSSDTGKSLLAQQFTVANAQKEKVIFLTTESPKETLVASLKRISQVKGIPLSSIENNIIIVDVSKSLGLNYKVLLPKLELLVKRSKASFLVIDSLTALFEDREVMARTVTRAIYQMAKANRLTTLLISQKREDSPFSAKSAGGLAIGHIVDCNILLSKIVISSNFERSLYGKDIGEVIRTLRIDGCRLCGHASRTFIVEIDRLGLIKVVGPLGRRKEGE